MNLAEGLLAAKVSLHWCHREGCVCKPVLISHPVSSSASLFVSSPQQCPPSLSTLLLLQASMLIQSSVLSPPCFCCPPTTTVHSSHHSPSLPLYMQVRSSPLSGQHQVLPGHPTSINLIHCLMTSQRQSQDFLGTPTLLFTSLGSLWPRSLGSLVSQEHLPWEWSLTLTLLEGKDIVPSSHLLRMCKRNTLKTKAVPPLVASLLWIAVTFCFPPPASLALFLCRAWNSSPSVILLYFPLVPASGQQQEALLDVN